MFDVLVMNHTGEWVLHRTYPTYALAYDSVGNDGTTRIVPTPEAFDIEDRELTWPEITIMVGYLEELMRTHGALSLDLDVGEPARDRLDGGTRVWHELGDVGCVLNSDGYLVGQRDLSIVNERCRHGRAWDDFCIACRDEAVMERSRQALAQANRLALEAEDGMFERPEPAQAPPATASEVFKLLSEEQLAPPRADPTLQSAENFLFGAPLEELPPRAERRKKPDGMMLVTERVVVEVTMRVPAAQRHNEGLNAHTLGYCRSKARQKIEMALRTGDRGIGVVEGKVTEWTTK